MCNSYCFSTATTVARTRLNVTLYANCLSCTHSYCMIYYLFPETFHFHAIYSSLKDSCLYRINPLVSTWNLGRNISFYFSRWLRLCSDGGRWMKYKYGSLVKWRWQGKAEALGEVPVLVQCFSPQTPHMESKPDFQMHAKREALHGQALKW
jgi:hypothetical protein